MSPRSRAYPARSAADPGVAMKLGTFPFGTKTCRHWTRLRPLRTGLWPPKSNLFPSTTPHPNQAALRNDPPRHEQRGRAARDVQEEDVLPANVAGDKPTRDQPYRGAQGADAAPDAERLVALGTLTEHVCHDRERRRQHHRRPQPLQPTHRDQEPVTVRKPRTQ